MPRSGLRSELPKDPGVRPALAVGPAGGDEGPQRGEGVGLLSRLAVGGAELEELTALCPAHPRTAPR